MVKQVHNPSDSKDEQAKKVARRNAETLESAEGSQQSAVGAHYVRGDQEHLIVPEELIAGQLSLQNTARRERAKFRKSANIVESSRTADLPESKQDEVQGKSTPRRGLSATQHDLQDKIDIFNGSKKAEDTKNEGSLATNSIIKKLQDRSLPQRGLSKSKDNLQQKMLAKNPPRITEDEKGVDNLIYLHRKLPRRGLSNSHDDLKEKMLAKKPSEISEHSARSPDNRASAMSQIKSKTKLTGLRRSENELRNSKTRACSSQQENQHEDDAPHANYLVAHDNEPNIIVHPNDPSESGSIASEKDDDAEEGDEENANVGYTPERADLVIARLVNKDDSVANYMTEAQPVDLAQWQKQSEYRRRQLRRRNVLLLMASISLLVIATVIPLVIITRKGTKEVIIQETNGPISAPMETAPVLPQTSAPTAMIQGLPGTTLESLDNVSTPQYKAYHEWLAYHPFISTMEDWRKEQLFALVTFYYSFEGEYWPEDTYGTNWLDYGKQECTWYSRNTGFTWDNSDMPTCNADDMYESLSLDLGGVKGKMPPEIAFLISLKHIDLDGVNGALNDVVGASFLKDMKHLSRIDLSLNGLTGVLPSELGTLLVLENLLLQSNQITGSLPTELGILSSLKGLYLEKNAITGIIPEELHMLTALKSLGLSQNQLEGTLSSRLGRLTLLERLALEDNSITGPLPREISSCLALKYLYLLNNSLNSTLPTELALLTSLQRLDAGNNSLSGVLPTEMGMLTALQRLFLLNNTFEGSIPSEVGGLTELELFYMLGNRLVGSLPTELGLMQQLRRIVIHNNTITGSLPSQLFMLPNLISVGVGDNSMTGSVPSELRFASSLQYMNFYGNSFQGSLLTEIGKLTDLRVLALHTNNFAGTIPSEIGMQSALEEMLLNNNSFSRAIPSELGGLQSLSILDLSTNTLSNTIPTELGLLTSLSLLNLSSNALSGLVPSELGNMNASACNISLLGNNLTGSLPSELCPWLCGGLENITASSRLEVDCSVIQCDCVCSYH